MSDIFADIRSSIADAKDTWRLHPKFYLFEPWDVAPRSPELIERAVADGVDLMSGDLTRCVGDAPHGFQTSYLLDRRFVRVMLAMNQGGKSLSVLIDILCRATGEIPIALRYPAGHDTGIQREISTWNIRRWGRVSKEDGKVIDRNINARRDGSWDCGNVTGVGVYPAEKIVPAGSTIRIASHQRLILQNWLPVFTGEKKDQLGEFMPLHFLDKTRGAHGSRGFNKTEKRIFLLRGVTLQMLTYDAVKEGFEGIKVPTYLDEEPPDEALLGTVITHATDWSLTETPYLGITYTRDYAFPSSVSAERKTYHATAYDCPYLTPEELEIQRSAFADKPWEIAARFWGIPTEQAGRPYYDRAKINYWIQRFVSPNAPHVPFKLVRFSPTDEWGGIKTDYQMYQHAGLMDVPVVMSETTAEDQKSVWRLYEDRLDGAPYVSASDQAEGADNPDDAGDMSTAVIARPHDDNPGKPVIAATIRSTLPTPQFAREVLYACRYFHNALLAPETGRGASNEGFKLVAADWPWWFKDITIRQSTRKQREQLGFCPTSDRRSAIFDVLIRDWFDQYAMDDYPDIPDEWILREAASAISGRTAKGESRCDHPSDRTLDSLTAFGILLFVFKPEYRRQIKYRGDERQTERKASWLDKALADMAARAEEGPSVVYLGEPSYRTR